MSTNNDQWQPIATAPKDGTRILGYGRGTDMMAWRCDEAMPFMQCVIHWYWHDAERYVPVGDGLFRKESYRALEMWKPIGPHFFKPTHWMPVPAGPAP